MNKKFILASAIFTILFTGCSTKNEITYNDKYNICIKDNLPAPFWICKKNISLFNSDLIVFSFKTYQFNSLKDEFNKEKRKIVLQESVKYFLKRYKKLIISYLGIKDEEFKKLKNKIYVLLTNNVEKFGMIDKIFVPFTQSNMRIESYVLVGYDKEKLLEVLKKLKTKNNNINSKYKNYYQ